jgi:hypothetical protein
MDNENSAGKTKKSGTIWIILTIVAFLLAVFFLAHTFINLKRHGFFGPSSGQNFHRRKINVADIQGWMTFDFLDKSFGLPPDYLKKGLGITDKKYPNITIDSWAKNTQENPGAMLEKTKKLIQDFENPAPPETPPNI